MTRDSSDGEIVLLLHSMYTDSSDGELNSHNFMLCWSIFY